MPEKIFKKNKKISILVPVMLCFLLCALSPVLANQGKTWVPVSGGERAPDGEPVLTVFQLKDELGIEMKTPGFFVSEQPGKAQIFKILQIGKYHGDLGPGFPNLPTLRRYIYIPKGKKVSIKVTPGSPVTLQDYLVYPVQKPREDRKDAVDPGFYVDDSVYRTDGLFPAKIAFIEESRNIRDHQIALLHICPFRYNPARRTLMVYPEINVHITFTGQSKTIDQRLQSPVYDRFIKGFVLNPGSFSRYAPTRNSEIVYPGAELLIITDPAFETAANNLQTHKENLGIDTIVKTTTDTGTTKTEIQNYIQNAYNNWGPAPSYVLLLGDVESIPTTYDTTTSRGTDLYYSTVSGSDYEPDIFLGRISVDTLAEANTVTQKIINYESSPPALASFYSNAAVAAYFQDSDYDSYEDRRFVRTSEEVRDYLMSQGYSIERIYYTPGSVTPTNYNNGYYGSGEPIPTELLRSSGFPWDGDAADITGAIDSGIFFLMHRDHGMDRNGGYTHTGWGDPYYVETHVNALTNGSLLPVVFSINCQTGWFDGETDQYTTRNYESFCELFLRNANGGAVGVFGATRSSYSGYNDFLAEGFIDCVWPDFLTAVPNSTGACSRLGPILNHGKVAMDTIWGDPWALRQTEYELFHVFGDPTMEMWTQLPGPHLTVTSPNGGECWQIGSTQNITWNATNVSVNLKITLWKDGISLGIIADDVAPASGSYAWTVGDYDGGTALPGTGYTVKVKAKGEAASDSSDAAFTLSQLDVTAPNGGEEWELGSSHNITWTAINLCGNLKITLWKDGVLAGMIADDVAPCSSPYTWTVGQLTTGTVPAGEGYTIKIKVKGSPVADESDAPFEITPGAGASITVLSPNGGENWLAGSSENITWNAFGVSGDVKITLWKDGIFVGIIATGLDPTSGSYTWTVGNYDGGTAPAGTGYTVKIKEIGAPVSDTSDASFEIIPLASWTFMVYLDGDNNLEGAGIDDFLEMSAIGSTADVKIVVQFDRIAGYDTSYDDWTGTKRFYVTGGMTPTIANAVMDLGEANMGDPATLIDFVNWSKANYPASNYALVMWNHGGGWRKSKEELWRDRDKKNTMVFKAVCWDDTNGGDCLYMSEVKSALGSSGGSQLIGFDACLMGMTEVAYEIKNYGQVVVGSEEVEPGDGWPYNDILDVLTLNPTWTAAQFGKRIVNKYYDSYGGDWTQSAVDLSDMNSLAATISTFAQTMIDDWSSDPDAVKSAAQDVMTKIESTVIKEQHGVTWPGAHGLAIYFPETSGGFDSDYNGTIIDFPADTQWEEFLQEFYSSMGGSWIAAARAATQEFYYTEHIDLYHFCEMLNAVQGNYYNESQVAHTYAGGGTAQSFHYDDYYMTYSLPFDFPYFDETISAGSTIYIASNGYVDFDSTSNHYDYSNSTAELVANKRIAPFWTDLLTSGSAQTGEDIYITENADNVVIRWVAETFADAEPVNFELVLYQDGRIQFNYGSGNVLSWYTPTIGISKGDSINYYLSVYDGQSTLTNVASDLYTPLGTITVNSPNGGENWTIGNTENITWNAVDVTGNLKITLWKDGVSVGIIADDVDPASGTIPWTVGNYIGGTAAAGTGYTIKIKEIGAPVSDTSDSAFTLISP